MRDGCICLLFGAICLGWRKIFTVDTSHYRKFADGRVKCVDDEVPFEVPEGWEWCRLVDIVDYMQRGKSPVYSTIDKYPVLAQKCNQWSGISLEKALFLDPKTLDKYTEERFLRTEDIVINSTGTGTLGRIGIFNIDILQKYECIVADSHITVVRCNKNMYAKYVYSYLCSEYQQKVIEDNAAGSTNQKELYIDTIKEFLLPIPPLKEQYEIVSKIECLFALIDEIEENKLSLEQFVKQTKSKVLDLAIHGKLVPQDPNDEPASVLLKRIKSEQKTKEKTTDNSHYPFNVPESWVWCRLRDLCDYGACNSTYPSEIPNDAWILDLEDIEKETAKLLHRIRKIDRTTTSIRHIFVKGNVLYSKLRTYLNKVLIADMDGFCTTEILPLDFRGFVISDYARYVLMSQMFLDYTAQCGYGVKMPRLGTSDGRKAFFPLPPLAEQKRIVSKAETIFQTLDNIQNNL